MLALPPGRAELVVDGRQAGDEGRIGNAGLSGLGPRRLDRARNVALKQLVRAVLADTVSDAQIVGRNGVRAGNREYDLATALSAADRPSALKAYSSDVDLVRQCRQKPGSLYPSFGPTL